MKSLIDLEPNDCRYPMDQKDEDHNLMMFCANPKTENSSYCLHHTKLTMTERRPMSQAQRNIQRILLK